MLNFVLLLQNYFITFTEDASLPLHSRARIFLGLTTECTHISHRFFSE